MKNKQMKKKRKLWLFFLFCIVICVRFLLCPPNATISIYGDELRYFNMASSILSGNGLMVHHIPVDYQKLFTALTYLPAYLFSGVQARFHAAFLINCLWMASGIFPLWGLSCKILKNRNLSILAVAMYLLSPDFTSTATFMSESNHVPMTLWYFWLLWKILSLPQGARALPKVFVLGFLCWLLYFSKETAAVYLLSWIALCGLKLLLGHFRNLCDILMRVAVYATGFLLPFLISKATIFSGMGNSYRQSSITALFKPGAVEYLFYAFLMQLLCAAIAFFIVPLIVPAVLWKKLQPAEQELFLYLMGSLVLFCAVVAYSISIRESLGLLAIRPYTRYFSGMLYVFLILLLRCIEIVTNDGDKTSFSRRGMVVSAAAVLIVLALGRECSISCYADSYLLNTLVYIPNLFSPEKMQAAMSAMEKIPAGFILQKMMQSSLVKPFVVGKIICTGMAILAGIILWMIYRKNSKMLVCFVAFFAVVSLTNNGISYAVLYSNSSISKEEATMAEIMAQKVSDLEGNVVCLQGSIQANLVDSYFDLPNVYPMRVDGISTESLKSVKASEIVEPYSGQMYDLEHVDYILVLGEHEETPVRWNVKNAEQIEVPGTDGYLLYRNLNQGEISLGR